MQIVLSAVAVGMAAVLVWWAQRLRRPPASWPLVFALPVHTEGFSLQIARRFSARQPASSVQNVLAVYAASVNRVETISKQASGEVCPPAVHQPHWLTRHLERRRRRTPQPDTPLDEVLDSLKVASIIVSDDGVIMRANAECGRLFGYGGKTLDGAPMRQLVPALRLEPHAQRAESPESPESQHAASEPLATSSTHEVRARHFNGSEFPARVALSPILFAGRAATLATIADMTEHEELTHNRQELAHLSRVSTMGELAGSLAHELNQPLTAILSNVQAAQRFMGRDPIDLAEIREILNDIVDDSCRASEVIRRIRALVRKEDQQFGRLDPASLLRDAITLVQTDAIVRGVQLSLEIEPGLPAMRGDKVQLQQVLLNLLLNAFDAVSGLESHYRTVVAMAGVDRDGMLRIAVRDRGRGLTVDRLERIFKPFVTSKPHGLGLGLSISRSIMQAHGGRLWAENNPDRGMTFVVTLPAASEATSEAQST